MAHGVEHEVEVVQRGQPQSQDFFGHEQMAQVGQAEGPAGVAWAIWLNRIFVSGKAGVAQIHSALLGEDRPIAGNSRGQNTVKLVHAAGDTLEQILRAADAH